MGNDFLLLLAVEAVLLAVFFVILLLIRTLGLKQEQKRLQSRLGAASAEASELRQALERIQSKPALSGYWEALDQQLSLTLAYHATLGSSADIVLDLDPGAPTARHIAAMRHALLIAEREAVSDDGEAIDWEFLEQRYQQLLSFTEDYRHSPPPDQSQDIPGAQGEVLRLQTQLGELQARYDSLEAQLSKRKSK